MHTITQGDGKPLLLIHGVGSNSAAWRPILSLLPRTRQVIAVDLPGHGTTPALDDSGTFAGISASLQEFLTERGLTGADMVGASLGGRLVLEMARLGLAGNVAALNPGGFWAGWERTYLQTTLLSSAFLLRSIGPLRGALATNFATRSLVMAQLSAHPWKLEADLVAAELDSIANTRIFNELVTDVATIPAQNGPAGAPTGRVAIGWGRHDRLCWPVQAERAAAAFPSARLHWFEHSGHYSWWDEPDAVARVIAETVGD